jgi:hypothetical protein
MQTNIAITYNSSFFEICIFESDRTDCQSILGHPTTQSDRSIIEIVNILGRPKIIMPVSLKGSRHLDHSPIHLNNSPMVTCSPAMFWITFFKRTDSNQTKGKNSSKK